MPATRTFLRIFVASPRDLTQERAALSQVVKELNDTWSRTSGIYLEVIKWETHAYPGISNDAQAVINEELPGEYDIFIGLMWTRFGTPTGRAGSGTEEEFNRAYEQHKLNPNQIRIMFYFKMAPVAPLELDPQQLILIKEFQDKLGEKGTLYWMFNDSDEFAELARIHLSLAVQDYGKTWGTYTTAKTKLAESKIVMEQVAVENSQDKQAVTEFVLLDLWETVQENNEVFLEVMTRITEATQNIGERMNERTKELNELQNSGVDYDYKQVKRIINRTAEDMNNYAVLMELEVPNVSKTFSNIVEPTTLAIPLIKDFGGLNYQDVIKFNHTITTLRATVINSQDQLREYRDTVSSTPRATTALNHSKKRVVSILNRMDKELSASSNLLSELEKFLDELGRSLENEKNENS